MVATKQKSTNPDGASLVRLPNRRFVRGSFDWQRGCLQRFDEGRARFAHLVCHRRARKTSLAINLQIRECCKHPRHIYRYVAPTLVEAKNIVWNDPDMLFASLPNQRLIPWVANKGDLSITFPNRAIFKLEGGNKIAEGHRGKASHGTVFDEWAQHENPDIWPAIFQPMVYEDASRWAWFLYTPNGTNHAYDQYKELTRQMKKGLEQDVYTLLLKASQSCIIPKAQLERARRTMPDALFRQEFECDFLVSSDRVLIQPYVIERLENIHHHFPEEHRIISCDPAFSGDECVIFVMINTHIVEMKIMHPGTTGDIIAALRMLGDEHDIQDFIIDNIGDGRGVYDGMKSCRDYNVQRFDARLKSVITIGEQVFTNRRAEAWWHLWDEMKDGRVDYIQDPKTRKQLSAVQYVMKSNGSIGMELKEHVKKRLGESPDRADAFVAGVWGTQHVEPYGDRRGTIGASGLVLDPMAV